MLIELESPISPFLSEKVKVEIKLLIANFKSTSFFSNVVKSLSIAKLYFSCGGQAEISVSIRKNLENTIEIFGTKGKIKIFYPWLTTNVSNIELQKENEKINITSSINKNIYALELEKATNAIIQNKKEVDFPGANLKRSLEYIKILEKWKSTNI